MNNIFIQPMKNNNYSVVKKQICTTSFLGLNKYLFHSETVSTSGFIHLL